MDIQALGKKYHDYLIEQRRWFHAYPEVSGQEFGTAKHIREELVSMVFNGSECG